MKKMTVMGREVNENEVLLSAVIRRKGFEHPDTIWFAKWLETHDNASYEEKDAMLDVALIEIDPDFEFDED